MKTGHNSTTTGAQASLLAVSVASTRKNIRLAFKLKSIETFFRARALIASGDACAPVIRLLLLLLLLSAIACQTNFQSTAQTKQSIPSTAAEKPKLAEINSAEIKKLLESAIEQTGVTKIYDPTYVVLPYPMGDVPPEKGVCIDVVIRAFRKAGVDLQKSVHEDMANNFSVYPQKWSLKKPDTNIDHRRVPNLQTFFTRSGKSLAITDKANDYQPGDIVAWDLNGKGLTHIGLVSNFYNEKAKRYLIIHNIGGGTQAEDVIFDWKIIGHYRYF